jgi:hypothetical protein
MSVPGAPIVPSASGFLPRCSAAILAACLVFGAGSTPAQELPIEVDLELVLAADVSTSMDDLEVKLQRDGFAAAFRDPDVIQAIESGPNGRVAVAYFEWSGPSLQTLIVPWTIIDGAASAHRFADTLSNWSEARAGAGERAGTSISAALQFSERLLAASGYVGARRIVDLSADGENNIGPQLRPVRARLLEMGVVINGLPILLGDPGVSATEGLGGLGEVPELVHYFRESVIGGPGAFLVPATETGSFYQAIRQKLVTEIAGLAAQDSPS